MTQLISQKEPVARKNYRCMAYDWIKDQGWAEGDYTLEEAKAIEQMKGRGGMIEKGEKYIRQFCVNGGDSWTWKANKEMHDICLKYDMYEV